MRTPRASDLIRATEHWDWYVERLHDRSAGVFWWEAGPELRAEINRRITGSRSEDWIEFTLQRFFDGKLPMERCLSVGCGTGHLERRLADLGAFKLCHAFDISLDSLSEARQASMSKGIHNVHYFVADANSVSLPVATYDAIWIHSALHHVDRLEWILGEIRRSLKPGGLLILNEYVGPSRFDFPARQRELINICLRLLPGKYRVVTKESIDLELNRNPWNKGVGWFVRRLFDKVRDGDLVAVLKRRLTAFRAAKRGGLIIKDDLVLPSPRDVQASDPSEAVRSDEIVERLSRDFEIVARRDWGGNILQFLLADIAGNFATDDDNARALIQMLVNIEDTLIRCGELTSDFAYIVARPMGEIP